MIPTKNFSSRLGERVRLLSVHSTEGARTVQSLGAYFQRVNNASYHGAVDDYTYESYVNYTNAAWHLRNANQESDSVALCGFSHWTLTEWLSHPKMLDLCAAWLAERSVARKIPLIHITGQTIRDCMTDKDHMGGVVMHRDYTYATRDGTHTDLGTSFPLDTIVLPKARKIAGVVLDRVKEDNSMQLPVTEYRIDFHIPTLGCTKLQLIANTDLEKYTTLVYGVYAIVDRGSTPPQVVTLLNDPDGRVFPQWWQGKYDLPPNTSSVVVNYKSPVAGMVARAI
jgi:hypothetical protein